MIINENISFDREYEETNSTTTTEPTEENIKQSSDNINDNNYSEYNQSNIVNDFANDNTAFEDIVDNKRIQDEADLILDFSEKNPFGTP